MRLTAGANVLSVARYRLARLARQGAGSLLALTLLLGAIGGVALASLVTARETASSYSTLLARSNPSDMVVTIFGPNATSRFAKLPGVTGVRTMLYSLNAFPMAHGVPQFPLAFRLGRAAPIGSVNGEDFTQDRVSVTAGRLADPRNPDEFMATAGAERELGWHVGQRILIGFFTSAQVNSPHFATPAVQPVHERLERLVGTVVFDWGVVQDEVDRYPMWLVFTPAATRGLAGAKEYFQYALQLRHGAASVSAVEREIIAALPPGTTYNFSVTSVVAGEVQRSVRPAALALGVFGVMALLGAGFTGAQLIARQLRARREDQEVLRALGAPRRATVADALVAPAGAVLAGCLLAVVVAYLLSPLSPIGPVRPVLHLGLHADGFVLAVGAGVLCVATLVAAMTLAFLWAPGRRRATFTRASRGSALARAAANAGLPVSTVAGLHFALESGRGRSSVPVRSILVGVTLAVTMIGATLTFGSGLTTLVSHPALYGWNWDNALVSNVGVPPQSLAVLRHSPVVAGFTGFGFANAQVNGLTVPILLTPPNPRVAPPLLAGHQVRDVHQIVLGAATMAQLHVHLGDIVYGGYGTKRDYPVYVPPTRMKVVGVATLPAVGSSQTVHTSMGVGAEIDIAIEPPAFRRVIKSPYATLNGPNIAFVRFRASASPAQRRALLRRAAQAGDAAFRAVPKGLGSGDAVTWLGVQYPSEIVNYRSLGDTPFYLALGFASGIAAAFALTIVASVRRRRRDLALLKTLGFTRRQIGAAVGWQATVSVALGLVVGVPLGIVLGRWLWDLFAAQIYAVPHATVPTLSLVVLGAGSLALANVVAYFPSRSAARTQAALALRAE